MDMDSRLEKAFAMADVSVHTANSITKVLKDMPRTGKRRNIFVKSYNRRPRNKQKRAVVMVQVGFSILSGAMQMYRVMIMPVPKYEKGTT